MIPIHLRNVPPPIETFNHVEFLVFMAKWIKPECYLELGVRFGDTIWQISNYAKICCGVDSDMSHIKYNAKNNIMLEEKTTDDFFASLDEDVVFDMIFIDAYHSHEASLKDFINSSKHIIDDGFIFLHDTYPCEKKLTDPYFLNDCYRTPLYIKNNFIDEFEIVTLPFNPGLTIVKKMKRDTQVLTEDIK